MTKLSNTNTEPFLRPDSLIQQGAFHWKYFLTKFADIEIESFSDRSFQYVPILRLFFRDQICFDIDTEPFLPTKFYDTDTDTLKKIKRASKLWHHTRSKHSPVQRSKENPNNIGYQGDHVDPRANLANGHVHWRCQYCKIGKVFKNTFLLKTWFDLKVDFQSNYCASYLWQSSDPLALSQQIHRKGWW